MVDVDFSKFGGFIRCTERPFEVGSCLNTRGSSRIGNAVVKGVGFSGIDGVDNHYTISVGSEGDARVGEEGCSQRGRVAGLLPHKSARPGHGCRHVPGDAGETKGGLRRLQG